MGDLSVQVEMRGDEKALESRSIRNAEKLATMLEDYLKQRFGYKTPAVTFGLPRYLVSARRKKYDLYLRVTPPNCDFWPSDTLVIARIGFHQQRKGHGTHLMSFFVSNADRFGFTHIGIESMNPNSSAFAAALGFAPHRSERHVRAPVEVVQRFLPRAEPGHNP